MTKRKERHIICIAGKTNAGKSSLLNLLSGQKDFAIVDCTPGTTADTVITTMEIHGLGPVKVMDTAGVNELTELGAKKRKKVYECVEEADLTLIVLDLTKSLDQGVKDELELVARAKSHGKQTLIVYNLIDPDHSFTAAEAEAFRIRLDEIFDLPSLVLHADDSAEQTKLVAFLTENFVSESRDVDLLPSLSPKGAVLLVIPMDEETPSLRLLRPQDMAVERLLRNYVTPVMFRPDLGKARNPDPVVVEAEKQRYLDLVTLLLSSREGLQLIITDSQAFDVIAPWTPPEAALTSFSVMMAHYMSFGNVNLLIEGAHALDRLKDGDTVLITEACNHNRKCDDIGTVQIPRLLNKKTGGEVKCEFSFGRTFPDDLSRYSMVIHCGSCMIDRQKYLRRIRKAQEAGVPFTNYGFLLAFIRNPKVLERVLQPFAK